MTIKQGRDLFLTTQGQKTGSNPEQTATTNNAVQNGRDLYNATKGK